MYTHVPVLLQEVIAALQLKPGATVIDCTIGGGGHTKAILEAIGSTGKVLGVDRDRDAIAAVKEKLGSAIVANQLTLVHGSFAELGTIATEHGFTDVDGVLFDLGASSHHFDTHERGFSFAHDGPLDMRYDQSSGRTATDIVNTMSERELVSLFQEYGEERLAKSIARAIVAARKSARMTQTNELARMITDVYRGKRVRDTHIHPATRVFQALRIAVNDELNTFALALPQAVRLLKQGGRIAVITFHSIEDRTVKNFFRTEARGCLCPKSFPVCRCSHTPQLTIVTTKGIRPSAEELKRNPRARSATLRVAERM